MATTRIQTEVLKLIAGSRINSGSSYIAGGLALNHQLDRPRVSSDIDVFNDGKEALHPFDLATNKLLALIGRRVPRDWVDIIGCCEDLQPLAYLAWAACGKDPGFNPSSIVEWAARIHYAKAEFDMAGMAIDKEELATLSRKWHSMIWSARTTITLLPPEEAGKAVLDKEGRLFRGSDEELSEALDKGEIIFHEGAIRGAWPMVVDPAPEGENV